MLDSDVFCEISSIEVYESDEISVRTVLLPIVAELSADSVFSVFSLSRSRSKSEFRSIFSLNKLMSVDEKSITFTIC